jgi:hypothetical protein
LIVASCALTKPNRHHVAQRSHQNKGLDAASVRDDPDGCGADTVASASCARLDEFVDGLRLLMST